MRELWLQKIEMEQKTNETRITKVFYFIKIQKYLDEMILSLIENR